MRPRGVSLVLATALFLSACSAAASNEVRCGSGSAGILAAQAVPSATLIPCIAAFPAGWSYGGFFAQEGRVRFWMDSDRAGVHAIQVELAESCDLTGAVEVADPSSEALGSHRFELPMSLEPALSGTTFFTFTGGCVALRYDFASGAPSTLLLEANEAIDLFPRDEIVSIMEEDYDVLLCGADAPPCVGETGS